MLVYRRWSGVRTMQCDAEYRAVADEEERQKALAEGWFDSVSEALAPPSVAQAKPHESVVEDAPPTRLELETMGRELGIKFDGRTPDRLLREKIDEALK